MFSPHTSSYLPFLPPSRSPDALGFTEPTDATASENTLNHLKVVHNLGREQLDFLLRQFLIRREGRKFSMSLLLEIIFNSIFFIFKSGSLKKNRNNSAGTYMISFAQKQPCYFFHFSKFIQKICMIPVSVGEASFNFKSCIS